MFPDGVKKPKKIVMENVAHVFKNAKDHGIQNFLPIQINPISYVVFYSSTNNVDDYSSCTLSNKMQNEHYVPRAVEMNG